MPVRIKVLYIIRTTQPSIPLNLFRNIDLVGFYYINVFHHINLTFRQMTKRYIANVRIIL